MSILQVQSHGFNFPLNPIMSLFFILLPLTISLHVLKVISPYEQKLQSYRFKQYFFLLWKINHSVSGIAIRAMPLYLPLLQTF